MQWLSSYIECSFLALEWLQCACVCVCVCEREVVNMTDGNYIGCDSITKYVCLKCDKFAE